MRRVRTVENLAIFAIVSAILTVAAVTGHWPPRPDKPLHRAIGVNLARQALSLVSSGGQILVITRDTEAFPQPALDLLLSAFQKEVRTASGKLASVRRLQVDPLKPAEVPPGDFFELIRRGQPGQVLVSLLGPPLLSEEQWARASPLKLKIVAFCPGPWMETVDLGRLLEAGFLHAAIVSRPFEGESATRHSAPRSFEELYQSVTASERSKLPSATYAPP